MALQHPQTMTVEEYFHLEEADPEHRYEYLDGQVYMLAGGTFDPRSVATATAFCVTTCAENLAVCTILI